MNDRRKERGRIGESAALTHLRSIGYMLIEKNWRCKTGEIDLVMRYGDTLIIVEVRTTSSTRFGQGFESVDYRKQMRLRQLATTYMQFRKWNNDVDIRFDVVSVLLDKNERVLSIKHIPNAF